MNKLYLLQVLMVGLLVVPGMTFAATFAGGEVYSQSGTAVVDDNLYVGAGDVTLSGTVEGDLLVGGGSVAVSGTVRDDLAAAGGDVSVLGSVGGDARVAGGSILIDGPIGGDLVVAGGMIKTLGSVTVGKDASLMGGYVVFDGVITGDATLAGGEIVVNGTVNGNVEIGSVEKLTLGENANIGGMLLYKAIDEDVLEMHENAVVVGGVQFESSAMPAFDKTETAAGLAALFGMLLLLKLAVTAVAAIALVLIFTKFSKSLVTVATESFWMQVLRGLIVLVVVPVSVIILFVTVFGAYLALLLLFLYIAVLILSGIYSGVVFGALVMKTLQKENSYELTWWHALLGVLALFVVGLIPLVGWLIGFVFCLATTGSLFDLFTKRVWSNR